MAYLARYSDSKSQTENELLTLPRINFFSWFLLWRIPTLRILFNQAKCDENWELEQPLSEFFFRKILMSQNPEWIVLFPEVNVWTEADSALHKKQSEKYYLPILQNVLYPRFSSFYNVITTLHTKENYKVSNLYDITILYKKQQNPVHEGVTDEDYYVPFKPPTLLQIFSSQVPITVTINVKSKVLSRISVKRKRLERWLEHSWVDKDKLISHMCTSAPIVEVPKSTSLIDVPIASLINSPLA